MVVGGYSSANNQRTPDPATPKHAHNHLQQRGEHINLMPPPPSHSIFDSCKEILSKNLLPPCGQQLSLQCHAAQHLNSFSLLNQVYQLA